ncbi:MAG: hypothetical protein ACXWQQ_12190 [Pseudobdellovibrio sp.]
MNTTPERSAARKFFRNPALWMTFTVLFLGLYAYTCFSAGKLISDRSAIYALVSLWMCFRVKRNP